MLSIVGEMIHVVVCPPTALEDRIEKVVDAVLEGVEEGGQGCSLYFGEACLVPLPHSR